MERDDTGEGENGRGGGGRVMPGGKRDRARAVLTPTYLTEGLIGNDELVAAHLFV